MCIPLPPTPLAPLLHTQQQVVQQCVATEGVEAEYVKTEVLPEFFRAFWQRRMALDRRNYRALVETTVSLANRVRGGGRGVGRVRGVETLWWCGGCGACLLHTAACFAWSGGFNIRKTLVQ